MCDYLVCEADKTSFANVGIEVMDTACVKTSSGVTLNIRIRHRDGISFGEDHDVRVKALVYEDGRLAHIDKSERLDMENAGQDTAVFDFRDDENEGWLSQNAKVVLMATNTGTGFEEDDRFGHSFHKDLCRKIASYNMSLELERLFKDAVSPKELHQAAFQVASDMGGDHFMAASILCEQAQTFKRAKELSLITGAVATLLRQDQDTLQA